jgi:putative acetyltransferase
MSINVEIRPERSGDQSGIRRVNERAFAQSSEADIVDAVRSAGAMTLSLVALLRGEVVGHILFSPVTVQSPNGNFDAVGLAPMAVVPELQKNGIGSQLVQRGLAELCAAGHELVVVLGHPAYYPRFGLVKASTYGIRSEYDVPDEVFMALELKPGVLRGRGGGVVRYRPEFAA